MYIYIWKRVVQEGCEYGGIKSFPPNSIKSPPIFHFNILNIVNFRKMEVYMEESRFVKRDLCPRGM